MRRRVRLELGVTDLTLADDKRARVADVGQDELVPGAQDGDEGRAHAVEVRVVVGELTQSLIGQRDPPQQRPGGIRAGEGLAVETHEGAKDRRRGNVTTGMTAHAVGHREKVRTGIPAVLVVGAHHPDVGARCVAEREGHLVATYFRSSMTVVPNRISVPVATGVGASRRC